MRIAFMATILAMLTTWALPVRAQEPQDMGEFTDEDFAQFFGLIEDGKITQEKMRRRCATKQIGFTFSGANLTHDGEPQRVHYNETELRSTVDGRPLRSKFHNAAFGEWTGYVFKPICGGLFAITLNYSTVDLDEELADDVRVHIRLRREGEDRPGKIVASAVKSGGDGVGNGHATIILTLETGDEVSTYSEAEGASQKRVFERITFSAYKIAHLDETIKEFDTEAWDTDLKAIE